MVPKRIEGSGDGSRLWVTGGRSVNILEPGRGGEALRDFFLGEEAGTSGSLRECYIIVRMVFEQMHKTYDPEVISITLASSSLRFKTVVAARIGKFFLGEEAGTSSSLREY